MVTGAGMRIAVLVLHRRPHTGQATIFRFRVCACSLPDPKAQLTVPGTGRPGSPKGPAPIDNPCRGFTSLEEVINKSFKENKQDTMRSQTDQLLGF